MLLLKLGFSRRLQIGRTAELPDNELCHPKTLLISNNTVLDIVPSCSNHFQTFGKLGFWEQDVGDCCPTDAENGQVISVFLPENKTFFSSKTGIRSYFRVMSFPLSHLAAVALTAPPSRSLSSCCQPISSAATCLHSQTERPLRNELDWCVQCPWW